MDKEMTPKKPVKLPGWHSIPALVILGLAVHLLIPQIASLQHSWSVVREMTWWAVILAVAAKVMSYVGSGIMLHRIVKVYKQNLSVFKGALITLASVRISLIGGGFMGGATATYTWIRRESRDGSTAVVAGTLPGYLYNAVLVGLALIGTLYLILLHDLTNTQLIEFGIILLFLGGTAAALAIALRFREAAIRFAVRLAGRYAGLRHNPFEPAPVEEAVKNFFFAWDSMRNGNWVLPFLGAVISIAFDMVTLFFMFLAAGYPVSLGVLFAGYGLPVLVGKMAFIFPGGVGIIEGSMVALYTSLKVPNPICVVVILGYRLISFWLPTILGFVAAAYLSHKRLELS